MATYRATRNENRVGIGNFTKDFVRGHRYNSGDGPGQVPEYICQYLVSHGILVDDRTAEGPMDTPAPPVSPNPKPKITPLETVTANAGTASVEAKAPKKYGDTQGVNTNG